MQTEMVGGQQIDRYRILRHIARGGMADVYLAEDMDLRRKVALKVMLEALAREPEFVQRFRREAQAVARLDHPSIVQVYSTGLTDSGQPYIAMQFIEGGSLRETLEQLAERGKLLTTEQSLNIVRQLAQALGVAHKARIVHRDLKPSNVLIRPDGTPVLADLGIVAVGGGAKLTQTGSLMGTPSYMSPDQVRGMPLDGRSDLYSLGIILYEMLTGTRPFVADEAIAVLHKQVYEEPVPLQKKRPDLSLQTQYVVEICMRKDPAQRFQTADEVVLAIDQALQAEGVAGPNPQATQVLTQLHDQDLISRRQVVRLSTGEQKSRRRAPAWIVATLVVLVAALGLIAGLQLIDGDGDTSDSGGSGGDPSPAGDTADEIAAGDPEMTLTATLEARSEPSDTPVPIASDTATAIVPPADTSTAVPPTPVPATKAPPTPVPVNPTPALPQRLPGDDGVEMRLVPAGAFVMGSTADQVDAAVALCQRNPDGEACQRRDFTSEFPQHEVFASDFYMDLTEISNAQYRACVLADGCNPPAAGSGPYRSSEYYDRPQFADFPVVWVTWFDARDYCNWAGKRLPTEAEWEKAARGEDGAIFPWGDQFSSDRANTQDRGREAIQVVGQYPSGASPYGLLDMAGNVWEYVADWFDPDYYFNSPSKDPGGPNASPTGQRVLRSGSYANFQHYARVANRGAVTPDSSTQFRGIRCAADVP
jgi:serine/threonine-protein kinase